MPWLRRLFTVRAQVSPCWICDRQNDTWAGFSPSSSVLPYQYHSTVAVHTHISPEGQTLVPLVATV
jgi:hypothetical protein